MIVGSEFAPFLMLYCLTIMLLKNIILIKDEPYMHIASFLLSSLTFYGLGHQMTLNSIRWKAAFVGLPGNFPTIYIPGALIVINVYAGNLVGILHVSTTNHQKRYNHMMHFILLLALKTSGSMLACHIHLKHLMFYKVFATKFIFEAISLVICCIFSCVISLINK